MWQGDRSRARLGHLHRVLAAGCLCPAGVLEHAHRTTLIEQPGHSLDGTEQVRAGSRVVTALARICMSEVTARNGLVTLEAWSASGSSMARATVIEVSDDIAPVMAECAIDQTMAVLGPVLAELGATTRKTRRGAIRMAGA
jgi:hypothetical protein